MEHLMIKIQDQHGDLFRIKMEIDSLGFVHRIQKTKYPTATPERLIIHRTGVAQTVTADDVAPGKTAHPQQDHGVFDDVAADKPIMHPDLPEIPKPQDQDLDAIVNAIQKDLAKNRKKRRQMEKRAYRKFLLSELFFGGR